MTIGQLPKHNHKAVYILQHALQISLHNICHRGSESSWCFHYHFENSTKTRDIDIANACRIRIRYIARKKQNMIRDVCEPEYGMNTTMRGHRHACAVYIVIVTDGCASLPYRMGSAMCGSRVI